MAVTITRTAWTDDDGSGTVGTVINNAEKTTLYGQIDAVLALLPVNGTSLTAHGVLIGNGTSAVAVTAAGTTGQALRSRGASADPAFGDIVQTTTSTGTVNDFALTAGASVLRCNNATLLTLTGITAGFDGQRLVIVSVGAGQVDLSHQAAGSTAANRLINYATSAATSLAAGSGTAEIEYDATTARWRLIAHEQGAWITPAYAGGNFTGNVAMTWTVDAGDVTTSRYRLNGRTVTYSFNFATTTIGGTPNTLLQVSNAQWGGFTIAATSVNALAFANDGTVKPGYCRATAAATLIELTTTSAAAWAATTNLGFFAGELVFEVT